MKRRFFPDFETFASAAAGAALVPVWTETLADLLTPVAVAARLFPRVRRPFLLESAEGGEQVGRYSYLGGDPFMEVHGDAQGLILARRGEASERLPGDPVAALAGIEERFRAVPLPGAPPFAGGAVGYVGYEAAGWVENVPPIGADELPWAWLGYYDAVVAFDHLKHRIKLVANAHVDGTDDRARLRQLYDDACERILEMAGHLDTSASLPPGLSEIGADDVARLRTSSDLSEPDFVRAVSRVREHIQDGDAFQVVISRRIRCEVTAEPLTVYRALRAINPSPYMFCLDTGEAWVVGSSPEMLVRVQDGVVETRPIAGTRGRGGSVAEDDRLAVELLSDDKERAEHLMLVDLGRNDIGRVAELGGVEVPTFMSVERYSHVMHIVSAVRGRLREGVSAMEALFACFPAGTVSGAPKIRAMEIISELDGSPRGVYAGAVLYADFAGNLNSCIAIRTVVMRDGVAETRAGAGLVMDSDPQREFAETEAKAAAALQALAWAEAATRHGGAGRAE